MNERSHRLVVGVCGALPNRQALELAAEMARLFSARMSALLIEDGASDALGAIPFAREYIAHSATGWRDIHSGEMAVRRESARRRARALFDQIAAAQGLTSDFETVGAAADLSRAVAAYDIVALTPSEHARDWMALPFASLAQAALHARAATLIVPSRIARRRGPIAALLDAHDYAAVDMAAQLARAADENLVLLASDFEAGRDLDALAARAAMPPHRLRILDIDGAGLDVITRTLGAIGERALVLGRGYLPHPGIERLIRLAATRGAPVIIPGATEAARQAQAD